MTLREARRACWLKRHVHHCSPMQESGAGDLDEGVSEAGSPNLDEPTGGEEPNEACASVEQAEEPKNATKEKSRKRPAEDGRIQLVDRHEKMGRASYCKTDSYAPKSSRLSEIAPRPMDEDDGKRRSKRRKLRPLQYWRGERIEYARAAGAAVPEGHSPGRAAFVHLCLFVSFSPFLSLLAIEFSIPATYTSI